MSSPIFVECPACNGEGHELESVYVSEPGCGFYHLDAADMGPCPYCEGYGTAEISGEEITLGDLDA